MTPDQRAALEILLDAQNTLDTDTQLMPLIRFVLFGTTGTVEGEAEPNPDKPNEPAADESPFDLYENDESVIVKCAKCGASIVIFDAADCPSVETMYKTAFEKGYCPKCRTKFK